MSAIDFQALQNAASSSAMEGLPLTRKDMDAIQSILEGKTAVSAGHVFEEHPDDLVKIIGLYTYQNSPEREFNVKAKDTFVECNGIRFKEFIVEGRKA